MRLLALPRATASRVFRAVQGLTLALTSTALLHLAWSYLRSRALLAFSSLAIALGVGVLFCVLGVFNGFLSQFELSLREFAGDAVVRPGRFQSSSERSLESYLHVLGSVDDLASAEPRLNWFALIGRRGARAIDDPRTADLSGLLLVGVDAESLPVPDVEPPPVAAGEEPPLPFFLGDAAAERNGLVVGDELTVVTFHTGSRGLPVPAQRSFRLAGLFDTGAYEQDLDRALVRRADLAAMVQHDRGFSQIVLRGSGDIEPDALAERVDAALVAAGLADPAFSSVTTWRELGGNFLRAVENQKGILSTVFFLIVLVAAYQLFATLTLTVAEKRRDIGVLGALGAEPGRVVGFFVSLGLLIASVGTGIGLLLGWWLSHNLESVERLLGGDEQIFTAEIYQFDTIPVAVDPTSIGLLVLATLSAALVFSSLPAWRAARVPVVRALTDR